VALIAYVRETDMSLVQDPRSGRSASGMTLA
jgi:hypothetical protein